MHIGLIIIAFLFYPVCYLLGLSFGVLPIELCFYLLLLPSHFRLYSFPPSSFFSPYHFVYPFLLIYSSTRSLPFPSFSDSMPSHGRQFIDTAYVLRSTLSKAIPNTSIIDNTSDCSRINISSNPAASYQPRFCDVAPLADQTEKQAGAE